MCDVAIQGVVISAFHFAVQLERSPFQIHPHTDAERETCREERKIGEKHLGRFAETVMKGKDKSSLAPVGSICRTCFHHLRCYRNGGTHTNQHLKTHRAPESEQ